MTTTVETLEKLERKITLSIASADVAAEVQKRLQKVAKTVKIDGFRPGKVPMSVVAQRYGYSVQYEVLNDQVNDAFFKATQEAGLRVAGSPQITEKEGGGDAVALFDAVFEVMPEVKLGDLGAVAVEKVESAVSDDAIEKTLEILRKQRQTFAVRAQGSAAATGDRLTLDFTGKLDGEAFAGGSAQDFAFVLGEGQMLPEFETAATGMKVGESKSFVLPFPENYHAAEMAGKSADFLINLKKIESAHLPTVDDKLAKILGIKEGTVEALKGDIRRNLEREVKFRLMARNKAAALDAVVAAAECDLPKVSVNNEIARMGEDMRARFKQQGIKDADKAPLPDDIFRPQAEKRVRMGLVIGELVRSQNLQPTVEEVKTYIDELASSYENPAQVVQAYYSDTDRMGEAQAVVLENKVTEFILSKAKVTSKTVKFDELMAQQ